MQSTQKRLKGKKIIIIIQVELKKKERKEVKKKKIPYLEPERYITNENLHAALKSQAIHTEKLKKEY